MSSEIGRVEMEDLIIHKNCELQLRDSPFNDGGLYLYCLDHDEFIFKFEAENESKK